MADTVGTDVGFTAEEEAFRGEVLSFLTGYQGLDGYFHRRESSAEGVRKLYRALGERGWLSLSWPREFGGMGRSPAYEFILWDEMAYARVARPPMGPGLVAKALMAHGTPEQCARFLPDLRLGRTNFCLGYSEPDAGSDLAAVRTRATPLADGPDGPGWYEVDGAKCWTSNAHWADHIWLLCRTGAADSRSRGLSVLIVPLDRPGVTVSPIPTHDGGRLNEVRFEGVRVPAADRVGAENDGWRVVASALAVERHVQFPPKRLRRDLRDLVAWTGRTGLDGDPVVRRRLSGLAVRVAEVEALALALLGEIISGRPSAVPAAHHKLAGTLLTQDIARAAMEFGNSEALIKDSDVEFMWRQAILETIGGGTSEVMRGLVARQAFGLDSRG
ncbi:MULTISPECIES: acyl-CoA dehydrogenase family protein [Streptomyces]|uniref:Acyl-CoA dehydrogenase n=1 Tax=Streptomyces cacaoi TaxID=1898 RepID=A0A4Y3QWY4_STRCI|nr:MULTISPECIES: acyl-CoA dehydrogenase family protein [Streptomyces]NNG85913.1 pilus assembly protein CpaD [Streptomyces cacaoi]QHF94653.1 pilus assembly protein CpaD [Streptomyces sp. NHF165]GEB49751.1 acyl-CoA dehydrogenase [Streptomyces cacaoi]